MHERHSLVLLEDEGFFTPLSQRMQIHGDSEDSPMEALCRSMFEFDDGWSFHASEKLLYGDALVHSQGSVGSCVGAGGGLALAAKASQEISNEGDLEEPAGWSTEDANRLREKNLSGQRGWW